MGEGIICQSDVTRIKGVMVEHHAAVISVVT